MLDFLQLPDNWLWLLVLVAIILIVTMLNKNISEPLRNYPQYRPYPNELADTRLVDWEWYWYQKRKADGVKLDGPNYLCPGCDPKLTSPKFNCWKNIATN